VAHEEKDMTEDEWLASVDPRKMLEPFRGGRASDRKLRLLLVACGRRVENLLRAEYGPRGEDALTALAIAERFADGAATEEEMRPFQNAIPFDHPEVLARGACAVDPLNGVFDYLDDAIDFAVRTAVRAAPVSNRRRPFHVAVRAEQAGQAGLLRCVFANPFRPVALDPSWLRWKDGALPKMAQAIYDERRFADLPVLADALEDAGCADAAVLGHCRSGREHVRGCWVIDLLLGKE
jgi:hypothetical protein